MTTSPIHEIQPWQWHLRRILAGRSDEFYETSVGLAEKAKAAALKKSQISKLQTVAYSAVKLADLLDYVKSQTGRRSGWRSTGFGQNLLATIREFGQEAGKIVQELGVPAEAARDTQTKTQLAFCREFIKHLTAHYLYAMASVADGDEG